MNSQQQSQATNPQPSSQEVVQTENLQTNSLPVTFSYDYVKLFALSADDNITSSQAKAQQVIQHFTQQNNQKWLKIANACRKVMSILEANTVRDYTALQITPDQQPLGVSPAMFYPLAQLSSQEMRGELIKLYGTDKSWYKKLIQYYFPVRELEEYDLESFQIILTRCSTRDAADYMIMYTARHFYTADQVLKAMATLFAKIHDERSPNQALSLLMSIDLNMVIRNLNQSRQNLLFITKQGSSAHGSNGTYTWRIRDNTLLTKHSVEFDLKHKKKTGKEKQWQRDDTTLFKAELKLNSRTLRLPVQLPPPVGDPWRVALNSHDFTGPATAQDKMEFIESVQQITFVAQPPEKCSTTAILHFSDSSVPDNVFTKDLIAPYLAAMNNYAYGNGDVIMAINRADNLKTQFAQIEAAITDSGVITSHGLIYNTKTFKVTIDPLMESSRTALQHQLIEEILGQDLIRPSVLASVSSTDPAVYRDLPKQMCNLVMTRKVHVFGNGQFFMDQRALAPPIIGETNPTSHLGPGFAFKDLGGKGKHKDGTKILRKELTQNTVDYNNYCVTKHVMDNTIVGPAEGRKVIGYYGQVQAKLKQESYTKDAERSRFFYSMHSSAMYAFHLMHQFYNEFSSSIQNPLSTVYFMRSYLIDFTVLRFYTLFYQEHAKDYSWTADKDQSPFSQLFLERVYQHYGIAFPPVTWEEYQAQEMVAVIQLNASLKGYISVQGPRWDKFFQCKRYRQAGLHLLYYYSDNYYVCVCAKAGQQFEKQPVKPPFTIQHYSDLPTWFNFSIDGKGFESQVTSLQQAYNFSVIFQQDQWCRKVGITQMVSYFMRSITADFSENEKFSDWVPPNLSDEDRQVHVSVIRYCFFMSHVLTGTTISFMGLQFPQIGQLSGVPSTETNNSQLTSLINCYLQNEDYSDAFSYESLRRYADKPEYVIDGEVVQIEVVAADEGIVYQDKRSKKIFDEDELENTGVPVPAIQKFQKRTKMILRMDAAAYDICEVYASGQIVQMDFLANDFFRAQDDQLMSTFRINTKLNMFFKPCKIGKSTSQVLQSMLNILKLRGLMMNGGTVNLPENDREDSSVWYTNFFEIVKQAYFSSVNTFIAQVTALCDSPPQLVPPDDLYEVIYQHVLESNKEDTKDYDFSNYFEDQTVRGLNELVEQMVALCRDKLFVLPSFNEIRKLHKLAQYKSIREIDLEETGEEGQFVEMLPTTDESSKQVMEDEIDKYFKMVENSKTYFLKVTDDEFSSDYAKIVGDAYQMICSTIRLLVSDENSAIFIKMQEHLSKNETAAMHSLQVKLAIALMDQIFKSLKTSEWGSGAYSIDNSVLGPIYMAIMKIQHQSLAGLSPAQVQDSIITSFLSNTLDHMVDLGLHPDDYLRYEMVQDERDLHEMFEKHPMPDLAEVRKLVAESEEIKDEDKKQRAKSKLMELMTPIFKFDKELTKRQKRLAQLEKELKEFSNPKSVNLPQMPRKAGEIVVLENRWRVKVARQRLLLKDYLAANTIMATDMSKFMNVAYHSHKTNTTLRLQPLVSQMVGIEQEDDKEDVKLLFASLMPVNKRQRNNYMMADLLRLHPKLERLKNAYPDDFWLAYRQRKSTLPKEVSIQIMIKTKRQLPAMLSPFSRGGLSVAIQQGLAWGLENVLPRFHPFSSQQSQAKLRTRVCQLLFGYCNIRLLKVVPAKLLTPENVQGVWQKVIQDEKQGKIGVNDRIEDFIAIMQHRHMAYLQHTQELPRVMFEQILENFANGTHSSCQEAIAYFSNLLNIPLENIPFYLEQMQYNPLPLVPQKYYQNLSQAVAVAINIKFSFVAVQDILRQIVRTFQPLRDAQLKQGHPFMKCLAPLTVNKGPSDKVADSYQLQLKVKQIVDWKARLQRQSFIQASEETLSMDPQHANSFTELVINNVTFRLPAQYLDQIDDFFYTLDGISFMCLIDPNNIYSAIHRVMFPASYGNDRRIIKPITPQERVTVTALARPIVRGIALLLMPNPDDMYESLEFFDILKYPLFRYMQDDPNWAKYNKVREILNQFTEAVAQIYSFRIEVASVRTNFGQSDLTYEEQWRLAWLSEFEDKYQLQLLGKAAIDILNVMAQVNLPSLENLKAADLVWKQTYIVSHDLYDRVVEVSNQIGEVASTVLRPLNPKERGKEKMLGYFKNFAVYCGLANPDQVVDEITSQIKGTPKSDDWQGPYPNALSSLIKPLRSLMDNGVPKLALSQMFVDVFTMVSRNQLFALAGNKAYASLKRMHFIKMYPEATNYASVLIQACRGPLEKGVVIGQTPAFVKFGVNSDAVQTALRALQQSKPENEIIKGTYADVVDRFIHWARQPEGQDQAFQIFKLILQLHNTDTTITPLCYGQLQSNIMSKIYFKGQGSLPPWGTSYYFYRRLLSYTEGSGDAVVAARRQNLVANSTFVSYFATCLIGLRPTKAVQAFASDPLSRVGDLNILINQLTILSFLTKMAFSTNYTPGYAAYLIGYPTKYRMSDYEVDLTGVKSMSIEALQAWSGLKIGKQRNTLSKGSCIPLQRRDVVIYVKVGDSNPMLVTDNVRLTFPIVINSDNTELKHIEEWVGLQMDKSVQTTITSERLQYKQKRQKNSGGGEIASFVDTLSFFE